MIRCLVSILLWFHCLLCHVTHRYSTPPYRQGSYTIRNINDYSIKIRCSDFNFKFYTSMLISLTKLSAIFQLREYRKLQLQPNRNKKYSAYFMA
jgi:hypothetical protein